MGEAMIPITKPLLGEEEVKAAGEVILSGWVTQGPEVAAFEREFAACVGAPYACAVSSCTAALHLALRAVGVGSGDEVITVSHSFIATANAIRYCGATPVFVDIEENGYNMDPAFLERVIVPRTRAILCVHQLGMPCDLRTIMVVARRHSLAVIEDAACAIGSEIRWENQWEKIGKPHGAIACFSFHPRKLITTGDGGMLTTANVDWDRRFRLERQHGMSLPDLARHQADRVQFESYETLGYNYRLTDIQAAVGREQLRRLPEIVARRRTLVERYRELLRDIPDITVPVEPPWARSNWQSFCVRLPSGRDQRAVMDAMLQAGVATRRSVMCSHAEPAYAGPVWSCGEGPGPCGCRPGTCARLCRSEAIQATGLILPLYYDMTDQDQNRVVAALRQTVT